MPLLMATSIPSVSTDTSIQKRHAERTAKDMEQTFFAHILKQLVPEESAYLGSSHGASLFRSFWVEALSRSGASESLRLAPQILRSIERHADGASAQNHASFHALQLKV